MKTCNENRQYLNTLIFHQNNLWADNAQIKQKVGLGCYFREILKQISGCLLAIVPCYKVASC